MAAKLQRLQMQRQIRRAHRVCQNINRRWCKTQAKAGCFHHGLLSRPERRKARVWCLTKPPRFLLCQKPPQMRCISRSIKSLRVRANRRVADDKDGKAAAM